MHTRDISPWQHTHIFSEVNQLAERGTLTVVAVTAVMMVVEIVAGWLFNSMALLADGWHMSSHAIAIGLSAMTFIVARRFAHDGRFAFGTWKIEILGGYTSALFLIGIAIFMVIGSVERLRTPQVIQFNEAIVVAAIGLIVNMACALILGKAHDGSHHHQDRREGHDHPHRHHNVNLRAAYIHVIADAMTSVFAIVALFGGKFAGWIWLDPVMGIAGAVMVAVWAGGLLRDTGSVLLDFGLNEEFREEIRHRVENLEGGTTRVADLHLWRVGSGKFACILSVVTHDGGLAAGRIHQVLAEHHELAHVTVEVNRCRQGGVRHTL